MTKKRKMEIKVGEIYAQYFPAQAKYSWPEYIRVDNIQEDGIFSFTLYSSMFDILTTSPGEGKLDQLIEGLNEGDIKKVDESELNSFICISKLLEK